MSALIEGAVAALNEKISGGFDGSAKFVLTGEGAVMVDQDGVRAVDEGEESEVTMTADPEVFQGIMAGEMDPTGAFMTGQLKIDGDMGAAMRLAGLLG
ncbi:MAG: SCP2 sterol-binding domain-containing protein [Pseudomonadota bacterium]